jgi:hypothetical protein
MTTESDINKSIIQTTTETHDKFPELSKFIDEMPVTIPDNPAPEINNEVLEDYQVSLDSLKNKYAVTHNSTKKSPNEK